MRRRPPSFRARFEQARLAAWQTQGAGELGVYDPADPTRAIYDDPFDPDDDLEELLRPGAWEADFMQSFRGVPGAPHVSLAQRMGVRARTRAAQVGLPWEDASDPVREELEKQARLVYRAHWRGLTLEQKWEVWLARREHAERAKERAKRAGSANDAPGEVGPMGTYQRDNEWHPHPEDPFDADDDLDELLADIDRLTAEEPEGSGPASPPSGGERMPIFEPAHNVREVAKELLLLEDHLFQPPKHCPDCIRKHLLKAEGLAEEAVTLDKQGRFPGLSTLPVQVRSLAMQAHMGGDRAVLAQQARELRKRLSKAAFGALDKESAAALDLDEALGRAVEWTAPATTTVKARLYAARFYRAAAEKAPGPHKASYEALAEAAEIGDLYEDATDPVQILRDAQQRIRPVLPELAKEIDPVIQGALGGGSAPAVGGTASARPASASMGDRLASALSGLGAFLEGEDVPTTPVRTAGGDRALMVEVDLDRRLRRKVRRQAARIGRRFGVRAFHMTMEDVGESMDAFGFTSDLGALRAKARSGDFRLLWASRNLGRPSARVGGEATWTAERAREKAALVFQEAAKQDPAHEAGWLDLSARVSRGDLYADMDDPAAILMDVQYRLKAFLPESSKALDPVVAQARREHRTARKGRAKRLVPGKGYAKALTGGEPVIYAYRPEGNLPVEGWYRGVVIPKGQECNGTPVESIPDQGYVAIFYSDASGSGCAWAWDTELVPVMPNPVSSAFKGKEIPLFTSRGERRERLSAAQLGMADLIQAVFSEQLGDPCAVAKVASADRASVACRTRIFDKLLLAAVINAIYESSLKPGAVGAAGEGGLFQLHPAGAGAKMSEEERLNPITNTERIVEEVKRALGTASWRDLVAREVAAGANAGTSPPLGEWTAAFTRDVERPADREQKAAERGRTADALFPPPVEPVKAVTPSSSVSSGTVSEHGMDSSEFRAFEARHAAKSGIVTGIAAANGAEAEAVKVRKAEGTSPGWRVRMQDAAQRWASLSVQTGEVWPMARSVAIYAMLGEVPRVYAGLRRIASASGGPWPAQARAEMAALERQYPKPYLTSLEEEAGMATWLTATLVLAGAAVGAMAVAASD